MNVCLERWHKWPSDSCCPRCGVFVFQSDFHGKWRPKDERDEFRGGAAATLEHEILEKDWTKATGRTIKPQYVGIPAVFAAQPLALHRTCSCPRVTTSPLTTSGVTLRTRMVGVRL